MARSRNKTTRRSTSQPSRRQAAAERFHPDPHAGLSEEQVRQRTRQGLHNGSAAIHTKTEGQIIRENVLTFFNILNFALALAVILVGSFRSTVFLGVILANIFIGSFQSIRAKRTLDKLSIVSAPKAVVLREGQKREIPVEEVVLDDILALSAGNQICSDAVVAAGECEVNESLITGESDPILKHPGDSLLSGSFIVSGNALAQVEHVGADNYATKITGDAKYMKQRNSEIMDSIDRIVKVVGFGILPIGALLFWKQFFVLGDTLQNSVVSTTAAMVGMIPEGLVLLVSVCFAVSVVKLSARKTLVRDLYCVETLARVDTLCLDKTGTITEGTMQVDELVPFEGVTQQEMDARPNSALVSNLQRRQPHLPGHPGALPRSPAPGGPGTLVPFSSARKWSGAFFPGRGAFVMGAGEFILGERLFRHPGAGGGLLPAGAAGAAAGPQPGGLRRPERCPAQLRAAGAGALERQDPPGGPPHPAVLRRPGGGLEGHLRGQTPSPWPTSPGRRGWSTRTSTWTPPPCAPRRTSAGR